MTWKTEVQSQVKSYQRLKKMVLDTTLLNTQCYKVRIKGKVEHSREWSSTPHTHTHLGIVATEKRVFGSPSTKGRQLYFTSYNTYLLRIYCKGNICCNVPTKLYRNVIFVFIIQKIVSFCL